MSETIRVFFDKSKSIKPATKSCLTLEDVDGILIELARLSKEDEQVEWFKKICKRCTASDLKMVCFKGTKD